MASAENDDLQIMIAKLILELETAKSARLVAETALVQEAEMRQEADAARLVAETALVQEAEMRQEADAARLVAETARVQEAEMRQEADAARLVAETARVQEAEMRQEADAARLVADAARLVADAARLVAETAREKEEKRGFFSRMLGISSSSASESANSADTLRRGAPTPVLKSLDDLLNDLNMPYVDEVLAQVAWKTFKDTQISEWIVPGEKFNENHHMHPTIKRFLLPLIPPNLKLWCNAITEDEEKGARIQPDFTVTHERDSLPSVIGAALLIEVKLPGRIEHACNQACSYLRRRIYRLSCECDARGELLHNIFAFALATDGNDLVILRMGTGAPLPGGSFATSVPCPVFKSPLLNILPWDFQPPMTIETFSKQPIAVLTLLRLLRSPLLMGPTVPLSSLSVQLRRSSLDGSEELSTPFNNVTLVLSSRLGCGGTSDAYVCTNTDCAIPFSENTMVLKVARCSTKAVVDSFSSEARILKALASTIANNTVPRLVSSGYRAQAVVGAEWPVLLLLPCGKPLLDWIKEQGTKAGESDSETSIAVRERCASEVVTRILVALQAAHANPLNIVHCDVRPSNIIIAEEGAVLIDWGHSRNIGDDAIHSGVVAYSDARMHTNVSTYAARPDGDLFGLIYTWFSIACNSACEAPWLCKKGLRDDNSILDARYEWISARESGNSRVNKMVKAHQKLITYSNKHPKEYKHMYEIINEALI
jgi:hypothetical protein